MSAILTYLVALLPFEASGGGKTEPLFPTCARIAPSAQSRPAAAGSQVWMARKALRSLEDMLWQAFPSIR
jgi:hypothetical protein